MWCGKGLKKSVKKRLPTPIKPSTTRLFETGLRWSTVLPLAQITSLRCTCSVDVQNVHPSYGIWSIKHVHIANWYSIFVCCSPNCKKKTGVSKYKMVATQKGTFDEFPFWWAFQTWTNSDLWHYIHWISIKWCILYLAHCYLYITFNYV